MSKSRSATPLSSNRHLLQWVKKMADLCQPAAVHWVDGSQEEYDGLCAQMVAGGTFIKLNQKLWPGCYYARSDADRRRAGGGPDLHLLALAGRPPGRPNNWVNPFEMRRKLKELFNGVMRGRTMYVLPFSMGPVGSPMAQIGVQLTDSPYVVVNMRIMARIGRPVFAEIDRAEKRVVPCMHSVGAAARRRPDATSRGRATPRNTSSTFPETREIWSYGSGYGGNALLGKKCFALRIASNMARDEGWMAEHMLILGRREPARGKDLRRGGLSRAPAARRTSP